MTNSSEIIVIDDDEVNNMVCTHVIKRATGGQSPKCFTNPVEGLEYIGSEFAKEHKAPTLIFLDINMPEMSGWEWLEKYKDFPESVKQQVRIYILSSSIKFVDIEQAQFNDYVTDYIIKPLNKAKIQTVLEAV